MYGQGLRKGIIRIVTSDELDSFVDGWEYLLTYEAMDALTELLHIVERDRRVGDGIKFRFKVELLRKEDE